MNKTYTKASLIKSLKQIRSMGWIKNARHGNAGGVGNTLEDLLGLKENNLPLPNAAEWELKCQRLKTNSLITLFHMEPSPTAFKFVPSILLPKYGWPHKNAGEKYPATEMSFRQTISALSSSDRGFMVMIDEKDEKVLVSFNAENITKKHEKWINSVNKRAGLGQLEVQPYWGFDDLYHKAGTKLHNCFFIGADSKIENEQEYFKYEKILMLSGFSKTKFISAIKKGDILIDFDARTGHNHGTKFRFRNNRLPELFDRIQEF